MKRFITSLQHALVKHLVKLRLDHDYRYEQQMVVMEGIKPIQEITGPIKRLIYTESYPPPQIKADEEWVVTETLMKKISGMTSSEGVMAEVPMPPFASLMGLRYILALDGINDPGNLGTLLRTALALGWEGIYLLPTSCDPYNEKAIRAARGAQFKCPLRIGTVEQLKDLIKDNHLKPFVADLEGQAPEQISHSAEGLLLVLGNEAHGASVAIKQICSKVTIRMPGEMESLNVAIAGGILMYVLRVPTLKLKGKT